MKRINFIVDNKKKRGGGGGGDRDIPQTGRQTDQDREAEKEIKKK